MIKRMDSTDTQNNSLPQPFDAQAIYQKHLQWLLYLMKQRGWRDYAWDYAKSLSRNDTSGLFAGLDQELLTLYKQHENRTELSERRTVPQQSQGQALDSDLRTQDQRTQRGVPAHQASKKQSQVGVERKTNRNPFDF
jgi:hypothetical protein